MFSQAVSHGRAGARDLTRSSLSLTLGLVLAAAALLFGLLAGPASAAPALGDGSGSYSFETLDNQHDPTFNQLLGINNHGTIAGYFGSGQSAEHPNKGYVLLPPYAQANYRNENFPGSTQTQVTGLNNGDWTVGFWVDAAGNNHGFVAHRDHFRTEDFPADKQSPQVDQLLGINDHGVAVGFYTDPNSVNHGYSYNVSSHRFARVEVSGDTNITAAAINDLGDIAGIGTNASGATEGFLRLDGGKVIHLDVPGASTTQALGVNDGDVVVGDYTVGSGNSAVMHGFVWAPGFGFQTVDDPNGIGATTLNGINDRGDIVGFYTDASGNTDGLLAQPQS